MKKLDEIIEGFSSARKQMIEALSDAKKITRREMEERREELCQALDKDVVVSKSSKGHLKPDKDWELFGWTGLKVEDGNSYREYLIDFFTNDIDENTSNLHSQIGCIQFAALIPGTDSPHSSQKGKSIGSRIITFNKNNLRNSGQSLCAYDFEKTEFKPFNQKQLVDNFFEFVIEIEKGRIEQ